MPAASGPAKGSAMTHESNAFSLTPTGDGPLMVWAAEFDDLDEIGFESACPALQAPSWLEAATVCGKPGASP